MVVYRVRSHRPQLRPLQLVDYARIRSGCQGDLAGLSRSGHLWGPCSPLYPILECIPDSQLTIHGNSFPGLDRLWSDAATGTLPQVSWIVGPAGLNEISSIHAQR